MPSAGINLGTPIAIYIGGVKITHNKVVGFNMSSDMIDISTKDSGRVQDLAYGRMSGRTFNVEGSFAEDAAYGFDDFYDAIVAGTQLTGLWRSATSGDVTYSATVLVSNLVLTAPDQDVENYTCTLSISGTITKGTV
jgi:hypothetical protein